MQAGQMFRLIGISAFDRRHDLLVFLDGRQRPVAGKQDPWRKHLRCHMHDGHLPRQVLVRCQPDNGRVKLDIGRRIDLGQPRLETPPLGLDDGAQRRPGQRAGA